VPPGALVRLTKTRAETLRLCAIFVSLPRALAAFTTIKKSGPPAPSFAQPDRDSVFVLVAGFSFSRPRSLIVVPVTPSGAGTDGQLRLNQPAV